MSIAVRELTEERAFRAGDFTIYVNATTCLVRVASSEWPRLQGSNYWRAHGGRSVWDFIEHQLRGDRHYTLKKLFAAEALRELDDDASRLAVGRTIREYRREGGLTREEASECLRFVARCDDLKDLADMPRAYDFAPWDAFVYVEPPVVALFWASWLAFCDHVRDHILPELPQLTEATV